MPNIQILNHPETILKALSFTPSRLLFLQAYVYMYDNNMYNRKVCYRVEGQLKGP